MRRYAAASVTIAMILTVRLGAVTSSSFTLAFVTNRPAEHGTENHAREAALLGQLEGLAHRVGVGDAAQMRAALNARAQAASAVTPADVAGADGRWVPLGRGPLLGNVADYPSVYGEGFAQLAGRVSDFAYDSDHKRLYASVAQGGLWESADLGKSWHPIGDAIPTQLMGSVGYSRAKGGTVIALTGDNAFGGDTYPGIGAYWSTDDGRTWHKSQGAPDGALGFKVAVDPTNSNIVYLATGLGLYRSDDDAKSFVNVDLPTGACHGNSYKKNCFLANVVTDVVVQGADTFGHKGGTVLAAVGWRAGTLKNFDGAPQAPANGLYRSTSGRRETFVRLDVNKNGFAPQINVGRVEMGAATGPAQNHGYVYALVQDAQLFNNHGTFGIESVPPPSLFGFLTLTNSTVLNGVYVSPDFGLTWTRMESGTDMQLPGNDSSLSGALAADNYGPGAQAWYDQWIRPDPTVQLSGVPTRVVFGLEEIWENEIPLPQNGTSLFHAIGPYEANGGECLLVAAEQACAIVEGVRPNNTTTHPDHHGGIFIPDGSGGVTLIDGNDGGVAAQHVGALQDFSQSGWGLGANGGFHTLLPYGVAVASDGSVYAGLQDNGELKIEPSGRQVAVYGGDGTMTLVDPRDPNVVYESTPDAGLNKSIDGGHKWTSINPFLTNPGFISPFVMDPLDADHLVVAGREIAESISGKNTKNWQFSWDTGTRAHPGDANAKSTKADPDNQASAVAVLGDAIYAGFCGSCDPVRDHVTFSRGLATNVSGSKAPKRMTGDGWHIANSKGLPAGVITSILIDPSNVRTIYVGIGAGTRPYVPPGRLGPDGITPRSGHLFVSRDAGASFSDISGNIRDVPVTWLTLHDRQMVVGTTVGVFISRDTSGRAFSLLGKDLPPALVWSIAMSPHDPNLLVAASFGRGVYAYHFRKAGAVTQIRLPKSPLPKPLPATGVAGHGVAGITAIALSIMLAAWMVRRRAGRATV